MSWTKRQFVTQAFEEIGYASYAFDLPPEQIEAALRRLDAMVATWNAKGIRLGYPLPSTPGGSNLDDLTGVPDSANEAIYTNLAIRIAPTVGKMVSQDTKAAAKSAYDTLLSRAAMPMEMRLPSSLPAGAGSKSFDQPFISPAEDPLLAGPDSAIDFT